MGIMADIVELRGAEVVGLTSAKGYSFESSKALRGDNFLGLAIDVENQSELSGQRIEKWVAQLKKEFGL
jgi:flavodoxin I